MPDARRMVGVRRTRSFQHVTSGGCGRPVTEESNGHRQGGTWALSPRTRRVQRRNSCVGDGVDHVAGGDASQQLDNDSSLSYYDIELLPLTEDLADWMNQVLGCCHLTHANILQSLSNGVLLCELCHALESRWDASATVCKSVVTKPSFKGRVWPNARCGSFQARENVLLFLSFCRTLGLHETMLFECSDLVLMTNPRQVVVCLLDVARVAARARAAPMSGLVALEAEIDRDKTRSTRKNEDVEYFSGPDSGIGDNEYLSTFAAASEVDASPCSVSSGSTSSLAKEIVRITQEMQANCKCSRRLERTLRLQQVEEGKYIIAGKIVFVRLLRSHVMVRVGGGWETLQNFIQHHDPCSKEDASTALRPLQKHRSLNTPCK